MHPIPNLSGFPLLSQVMNEIANGQIDMELVKQLFHDFFGIATFAYPPAILPIRSIWTEYKKNPQIINKFPSVVVAMALILDCYNLHLKIVKAFNERKLSDLVQSQSLPEEVVYFWRLDSLVDTHPGSDQYLDLGSRFINFKTLHVFISYLFDVMGINL